MVAPAEVVAATLDLTKPTGRRASEGAPSRPGLLLDADGVLFDTESRHLAALLQAMATLRLHIAVPEENAIASAYGQHARGRDRYEGMAALLGALGIGLEQGAPDDPPGTQSICAIANLKNEVYTDLLTRDGVPVMRGARDLLRAAHDRGFAIAVVSSSRHARRLLADSDLEEFVEAIIAPPLEPPVGRKPHPDPYLRAIEQLGVAPEACVAIEDAPAGVASARAAGVGRVVGLVPAQDAAALLAAGAHEVVDGLGRLALLTPPRRSRNMEIASTP